jgi:hypothetical protein
MAEHSAPGGATSSNDWRPAVNSRQVLASRLLKLGGVEVAKALHKDESTASRILSGERGCTIQDFCTLLELVELKVVDKTKLCVPADELRMLRRVYNMVTARDQLFEDAE